MVDYKYLETTYGRIWTNAIRASRALKYVYLNKPKCACITMKTALWDAEAKFGSAPPLDDHMITRVKGTPFTHDADRLAEIGDQIVAFTFVRNPYLRIMSCYVDKLLFVPNEVPGAKILPELRELGVGSRHVSMLEFLEFIAASPDRKRNPHWQTQKCLHLDGAIPCAFIGSVENLEADARTIFGHLFPGIEPLLENRNSRSSYAHPITYMGENEFRLAAQIYRDDFEYFEYSDDPEARHDPPRSAGWKRM